MMGAHMRTFYSYEPRAGHGLRHDPMNAIVGPRPIGWISSQDAQGRVNLAPYSFFNLFAYTPPVIGFASSGWKHTVQNVQETGEFVWNLATRPLADAMNATSASVPHGVDEFGLAGLTHAPSRLVRPPRVLESPVSFECRLTQLVRLKDAAGQEMGSWLVLGEVVMVHVDQALVRDGVYDTVAAEPIVRGGGPSDYYAITEAARFRMSRPG